MTVTASRHTKDAPMTETPRIVHGARLMYKLIGEVLWNNAIDNGEVSESGWQPTGPHSAVHFANRQFIVSRFARSGDVLAALAVVKDPIIKEVGPIPEATITLEMPESVARTLQEVLGEVGGEPRGPRGNIDQLYAALKSVNVVRDGSARDRSIGIYLKDRLS